MCKHATTLNLELNKFCRRFCTTLFAIHILSIIEYSLSVFFFHYCIDARTTQYYLLPLPITICLINLYLCTVIYRVVRGRTNRARQKVVCPAKISTWFIAKFVKKVHVCEYQNFYQYISWEDNPRKLRTHVLVTQICIDTIRETIYKKWRDSTHFLISIRETDTTNIIMRVYTRCCATIACFLFIADSSITNEFNFSLIMCCVSLIF